MITQRNMEHELTLTRIKFGLGPWASGMYSPTVLVRMEAGFASVSELIWTDFESSLIFDWHRLHFDLTRTCKLNQSEREPIRNLWRSILCYRSRDCVFLVSKCCYMICTIFWSWIELASNNQHWPEIWRTFLWILPARPIDEVHSRTSKNPIKIYVLGGALKHVGQARFFVFPLILCFLTDTSREDVSVFLHQNWPGKTTPLWDRENRRKRLSHKNWHTWLRADTNQHE